jgi:hypothetical protein
MLQNFQPLVQIELLIQQLHQLCETACSHSASPLWHTSKPNVRFPFNPRFSHLFAVSGDMSTFPIRLNSMTIWFKAQYAKVPKSGYVLIPIGRNRELRDKNHKAGKT